MGIQAPPSLSEGKATRMMAALRGGGTLNKFGVKAPRLEAYFNAHPEYAQEARPMIEKNAAEARQRKGACIRNKTHCANGHSFAEHGRVAFHKGYLTRQCKAREVMRYRRGGVMKVDVLEKIKPRSVAGSSISSFTKNGNGSYLVRFDTLARYRRENPDFDRLVIEATKDSNRKGQLRRWRIIKSAAVRDQNNEYYKIRAMLPANYPDKDAVISFIVEDLLTGVLKRQNVPARLKWYMAAEWKFVSTIKFPKFGPNKLRSLDAHLFEDGDSTLGDTATQNLWD
jgi:hypothetical protein